jgi:hypothetical protein
MPVSTRIPLTPGFATAILLSIIGLAFVLASRNVPTKRVVLPLTLLVFSAAFFLAFRQSHWADQIPAILIALALLLNAIWVWRVIAYCVRCGRTFQQPWRGPRDTLCDECSE